MTSPLRGPAANIAPMHIVQDALAAMRKHLNMPLAYFSVFDGDDLVFRAVSSDMSMPQVVAGDRRLAAGTYCQAVRDGILPQFIPDTSRVPATATMPIATLFPVGAMISIPITAPDGSCYGMFCCLSKNPMPTLTPQDKHLVCTLASFAAGMIDNGLQAQTLEQVNRQRIADVISDRDFQLLLQPIVELSSMDVVGAEALCRFRPVPYTSPDKWFADARSVGLHRELELCVLKKTLEMLPDLPQMINLSINISPDTLAHCDLPTLIDGQYSDRLIFELTEFADFTNQSAVQQQLSKLRALGAQIAINNMTSSYASLNMMLMIKPDIIKLDRDLIRSIHLDLTNQSLVAGIVHFCSAISARIIAEGIECEEEKQKLTELGLTHGQGYYLGRPGGMSALRARTYCYWTGHTD